MVRAALVLTLALLALTAPAAAQGGAFEARVLAVRDGDTLEVEHDGRTLLVEIAAIDCPELDQPYGAEAKWAAEELADGERVRVAPRGRRAGGRAVAAVRLPGGGDLAAELLRRGLAWWTGGEAGGDELAALERQARAAGRGLWADADPEPPWEARGDPAPPGLRPPVEAPLRAVPEPPRETPLRGTGCIPLSQCCRVCARGKACGDSCIQASLTCRKGRGCACDSSDVCG